MTGSIETDSTKDDYYLAGLEGGALSMQPFCGCGNGLGEDYFCDRCRQKCSCRRIVCRDPETLAMVKRYIRKSSRFSGFRAELAEAP